MLYDIQSFNCIIFYDTYSVEINKSISHIYKILYNKLFLVNFDLKGKNLLALLWFLHIEYHLY